MSASIQRVTKADIYDLIQGRDDLQKYELDFFRKCVGVAAQVWVGHVDGEVACFWGLIPPSLLRDSVYLWLYTTEALKGNEFVFIRQSQIAVKLILSQYSEIIGHARVENTKGIRWLRWLGAEFDTPDGKAIPFVIRRK